MWGSPAAPVPIEVEDDPDDTKEIPTLPWQGAEFSESWWSVVYGHTDDKWKRFFPEDPLKPRPPAPRRPLGPGRVVQFRKRR